MSRSIATLMAVLALGFVAAPARAATVSYQGHLKSSGTPFDGNANLRFRLYEQPSGGSAYGPLIVRNNWPIENGLFNVDLDFGADGIKFVSPSGFEAMTVEALRELAERQGTKIGDLETRLQNQQRQIARLEMQIRSLVRSVDNRTSDSLAATGDSP